jgi:hypothetical protein
VCEGTVVPDVLGFPLDEATAALRRAGVRVREVVLTAPPGAGAGRGEPRVVRQCAEPDGSVVLTVAFAEHESGHE